MREEALLEAFPARVPAGQLPMGPVAAAAFPGPLEILGEFLPHLFLGGICVSHQPWMPWGMVPRISSLAASLRGLRKYILDYLYHLPLTGVHLGGGGRRRAPEGTRINRNVFYRPIRVVAAEGGGRKKKDSDFYIGKINKVYCVVSLKWSKSETLPLDLLGDKNPQGYVLGGRFPSG